jgi:hypothetical protein
MTASSELPSDLRALQRVTLFELPMSAHSLGEHAVNPAVSSQQGLCIGSIADFQSRE